MFRSKYSYLFFLPFLVLLFILINPYWYGDGVWYALELKAHERLIPDAGHLIWIPLAFYLWKLLSIFYLELDPLLSLQLLSALGAVFLLHATYLVTRSLEFSKRSSSLTIITLACTHFMLVYGGSGSSYTCAAAALTYSTAFLLSPNHDVRYSLYALLFALLAWAFWGVSLLAYPALCLLYGLTRHDRLVQQIGSTILSGAILGLSSIVLLYVTYLAFVPEHSFESVLAWFQSSSHGIEMHFSLTGFARALLGYCLSLSYLGDLGKSLKFLLLGNNPSHSLSSILPFLILFVSTACTIGAGWLYALFGTKRSPLQKKYAIASLLLLLSYFLFALLWQGSDVERFSLVLPTTIVLIFLPQYSKNSLGLRTILPLFLFLFHFSTRILPPLLSLDGTPRELAIISQSHLAPESLIVLHGQRFPASLWAPAHYFSGNTFYNLQYDSQSHGKDGWKDRLKASIHETLKNRGEIAVHSSLLHPPEGNPLELSVEIDVPSLKETQYLFRHWQFKRAWYVGEEMFIVLEPPTTKSLRRK